MSHIHDLYRHVLDSFETAVAIFDADCRYLYVNPYAVRDPGIRAWLIGRTDAEYCAYRAMEPAIAIRRMDAIRAAVSTRQAQIFEECLPDAGGTLQLMRRQMSPIVERGDVVGVISYGYDVTELRRTQENVTTNESRRVDAQIALEQSEERFRLAARATNELIYDWNIRLGSLTWSGAIETGFGHRSLGTTLEEWSALIHPDDRAAVEADLTRALEGTAQFWQSEYRFRRGDGTWAMVLDRGYFLRDSRDEAFRMIGTMQDVTQRRQLEQQLRQAQKMEAVGKLAAGVAHDFNNILTAVSAYAELVRDGLPRHSPLRADVDEIAKAGARAKSLTTQLLAFSRHDVAQPVVLDLNDVVRDNLKLLERTLGEDVTIRVALHPQACVVRADAGQLTQVLLNLVINARDAIAEGGGTVTIETRPARAPDVQTRLQQPVECCELIVRDTGVGMDQATLDKLFEPFFTTKPVGKGTGLGLTTVFSIATQWGGTAWAESMTGEGSSLHVLLPRSAEPLAPRTAPRRVTPVRREAATVLLVEDEPAVRTSLARILERRGYTVVAARNGADALSRARELERIDAVISDVVMPGERGPKVVAALREMFPDLAVVYMSGYTDASVTAEELGRPNTTFLSKPFSFDTLFATLAAVLGERIGVVET